MREDNNYGRCLVAGLCAALVGLVAGVAPVSATAGDNPLNLSVDGISLVATERVDRTHFRYSYRVNVTNPAQQGALSATATVTSLAAGTVISQATVRFPYLPPSSNGTSSDTFSIVQDRTVPFNRSSLVFDFQYQTGFSVPNVVGLSVSSAEAALRAAWYSIISYDRSRDSNDAVIPDGFILSQSPSAGSNIDPFSGVEIVLSLSLGPEGSDGFLLKLGTDAVSIPQGAGIRLRIGISRSPGFKDDVQVSLLAPPAGITGNGLTFTGSATSGQLGILVAPTVSLGGPIDVTVLAQSGRAMMRLPLHLTVSPPMPLSSVLIQSALAAGVIDLGASYVYRMYHAFGDPRLPAQFQGSDGPGEDSTLLKDIASNTALISAAAMAQLHPYLVRPTDPDSIWSRPSPSTGSQLLQARARTKSAASPVAAAPVFASFCPASPSGVTWVHQKSQTPGVSVTVWARCPDVPTVIDLATERVNQGLTVMDTIWEPMTSLMGLPLPDTGAAALDPDTSIDVYILPSTVLLERKGAMTLASRAAEGLTIAVDVNRPSRKSGYILIDDDLLTRSDGLAEFHSTLTHEFFHLLQNAHNLDGALASFSGLCTTTDCKIPNNHWYYHWFVEASATWAEAHFDRTLSCSQVPTPPRCWTSRHSSVLHRSRFAKFETNKWPLDEPIRDLHPYAAYIWPFFMELKLGETQGAAQVAAIWQGLESAPDSDFGAMNDIVDGAFPFKANFPDFALRNLNQEYLPGDPLPKVARYVYRDPLFPDSTALNPDNSVVPRETNEVIVGVFPPSHRPVALDALSSAYYRVKVSGASVHALKVDWSSLTPKDSLNVDAVVYTAEDQYSTQQTWSLRRLKTKQGEVFCIKNPRPDPSLEVTLVLTNSEKKPGTISGDITFETLNSWSDCGCDSGFSGLYCIAELQANPRNHIGNVATALDINKDGAIAGVSYSTNGTQLPTVWQLPGAPVSLLAQQQGPQWGEASNINDSGQAAGWILDSLAIGIPGHFAYWPPGTTTFTVLADSNWAGKFNSIRLNNLGEIAYVVQTGTTTLPGVLTLWKDGVKTTTPLTNVNSVHDINNFGHVLVGLAGASNPLFPGTFAIWDGRSSTTVPMLSYAINDFDMAVGSVSGPAPANIPQPARWTASRGVELLQGPPGQPISEYLLRSDPKKSGSTDWALNQMAGGEVLAINNRGEAVGYVTLQWARIVPIAGAPNIMTSVDPVLWKANGQAVDLYDLLPAFTGVCINRAVAINDAGVIATQGFFQADWKIYLKAEGACGPTETSVFRLSPPRPF